MKRWALLALLLLAGCKPDRYEGHGLSWTPPHGVKFASDDATSVIFSSGIRFEVKPLTGFPAEADEGHLQSVADAVVPPDVKVLSKRAGTIPAGKVVRVVWIGQGGDRTLVYYLPVKDKLVLLTLRAPEAAFNGLETSFDLSLNSLKVQ